MFGFCLSFLLVAYQDGLNVVGSIGIIGLFWLVARQQDGWTGLAVLVVALVALGLK